MTNLEVFRVSTKDRQEYEQTNPLWKKVHGFIDDIIDEQIQDINVIVSQYLVLAHELLDSAKSQEDKKEVVVFFENMQSLVVLLPGYDETFSETQEEELLFSFDSEMQSSDIELLLQQLRQYKHSL